jgi:hypothetical protein
MDDITYVGFDVHKATVSVALAESGRGGEVRQVGLFESRPMILCRRRQGFGKGGRRLSFCYEDGDRGREGLKPSPPCEPCERLSRTRLSSRWTASTGALALRPKTYPRRLARQIEEALPNSSMALVVLALQAMRGVALVVAVTW